MIYTLILTLHQYWTRTHPTENNDDNDYVILKLFYPTQHDVDELV